MSESNPLNDFLNETEPGNDLFADFSFVETEESKSPEKPNEAAQQTDQIASVKQNSLFAEALAQTPSAEAEEDPFTAALKKAKAQSEERLTDSFAEKEAVFAYGKVKDPISDRDCTFEELRQKYETDFPELSEAKKVSWTVNYGKISKSVSSPGSDKVYDIKAEIEKSKAFLEGIKKAKTDAEKQPECQVRPRVTAQSKGKIIPLPSYKEFCASSEDVQASAKPIVLIPSRDGKIYEMRKTPVGTFTAPADLLPEFTQMNCGFQMNLPKIPIHILMSIINFFEKLSDLFELEALVHILYDTAHSKYIIRVPKQKLTHTSAHSVMAEEYPEHLVHVMDIHSHNTMPAKFSAIDNDDEKATRLYAVIGRLDQVFPDITIRASCAGRFIPVRAEEVFETDFKAYPYPSEWNDQISFKEDLKKPQFFKPTLISHHKEQNKNEIF